MCSQLVRCLGCCRAPPWRAIELVLTPRAVPRRPRHDHDISHVGTEDGHVPPPPQDKEEAREALKETIAQHRARHEAATQVCGGASERASDGG